MPFTGAEGELAVNTSTDTVHVHDGSTAGGFALAKADGSNIGTYAGSFTTLAASGAVTLSSTLAVTGALTVDTNTLVVDATNNRVGIGTSSINSNAALEVHGGQLRVASSSASSMFAVATSTTYSDGVTLFSSYNGSGAYGPMIFDVNGERLRIDASGSAVFNESGVDADFRVESDSNANMLFVDGGNNHVNIGTSVDLGGTLNLYDGSFRGQAAGALTATMMTPTAFGYAPGAYAVTMLGAPNTSGTVSIGYDPSGNPSGSFGGGGTETLFSGNMYFTQPNATDDGYVTQIRMENQTGVTINENGGDLDFRVESDNEAYALFVDGATGNVSLANNNMGAKFAINHNTNGSESASALLIGGSGYSAFHWLDGTAYYIGQNSAGRALRLYSSAEAAGVGLAAGATSFGTYSDERLKYDVEPIENALESLSNLRTVKYRLTEVDAPDSQKKLGLIAQDLVGVLDEIIDPLRRTGDETDYMSVRYTEMVPVLVKAIQEQQTLIETLEARITTLES